MKPFVLIATTCLLSACAVAPQPSLDSRLAAAEPGKDRQILTSACLREAKWPLYQSAAYKGGGARVRQQVLNMSSVDVRHAEAVCYAMSKVSESQKTDLGAKCQSVMDARRARYGASADANLSRFSDICLRMTT